MRPVVDSVETPHHQVSIARRGWVTHPLAKAHKPRLREWVGHRLPFASRAAWATRPRSGHQTEMSLHSPVPNSPHPAANTGIEHPLRHFQNWRPTLVIGRAVQYDPASSMPDAPHRDLTPIPWMPGIAHFPRVSFMGVGSLSCTTPHACTAPSARSRPRTCWKAASRKSSANATASWKPPASCAGSAAKLWLRLATSGPRR